ncbi:MAG: hypothetical protein M1308_23410 [Actinobacteria bacterium]|nr:hypothetical protein [Actinomycetota bacterium]
MAKSSSVLFPSFLFKTYSAFWELEGRIVGRADGKTVVSGTSTGTGQGVKLPLV